MKLCEYCIASILESRKSWDYHRCTTCAKERAQSAAQSVHSTPSNLEKPERCVFCSTILEDIAQFAPHLDSSNSHRWSIRSLSRIRESLETIVVTFHPLPLPAPDLSVSQDAEREASLPTRKFYFFPEAELGPWPTLEEIGVSTNPAINGGAQIKLWLKTCDETHTGCMKRCKARSASSRFVPTRLVDISGPPESPMKVIETKHTSVRSPYATLSHCWGAGTFVRLLPETTKQYIYGEGVPWHMLTKNFQEAIEVARYVGIEYIWIDSLCIIQGPKGDFGTEGGLMHQVYRNSYCNIAIVDSADSTGGAFRERDPGDVATVVYQPEHGAKASVFGEKPWRVVAADIYESELMNTKLYVRGWVFQGKNISRENVVPLLIGRQNVC